MLLSVINLCVLPLPFPPTYALLHGPTSPWYLSLPDLHFNPSDIHILLMTIKSKLKNGDS